MTSSWRKLVLSLNMSLLFLFCAQGVEATSIETCKSCHVNATCVEKDNKYTCMCNFGLIGNGRTLCLDKDECQIGAHSICGNHTACHNTHGSFYCICLKGYRPSNNNENFIPNDGTFCTDIDECGVSNVCGHNSKCKNTPGSYECYCVEGYRPMNGMEPFQESNEKSFCTDVDECSVPDICGHNSRCKNIPGSYECYCAEGYSVMNGTEPFQANGNTSLCLAVDCGPPPVTPNSIVDPFMNSTAGSMVTYRCAQGFIAAGGQNTSFCTAEGRWAGDSLICKAVDCGLPYTMPNAVIYSSLSTTFGSKVMYKCAKGFVSEGGNDTSTCTESGRWEGATLMCKEIHCGNPPSIPNAIVVWNGTANLGSELQYECMTGFHERGNRNVAKCTVNETWENINFTCTEVDCGMPSIMENAEMLWNNRSTLGSFVNYLCRPGFKENGGKNISLCMADGVWEKLNLTCTVKEGLISNISISNDSCIRWEKSNEIMNWTVLYKFSIYGVEQDQRDIVSMMSFNYSTDYQSPTVCLDLLPGNNYNVTITAFSSDVLLTKLSVKVHTAMKGKPGNIMVFNETCLQWTKSSRKAGFSETYTVLIRGKMWSSGNLLQDIIFNFSTDKMILVLCLELPPAAEYFVYVTGLSTDFSSHVHVNSSVAENANSTTQFNETCLSWNKRADGLRELYKLQLQGGRWYPMELLPELPFNISADQNISSVCLDQPRDTQPTVHVTETPNNHNTQLTTASCGGGHFRELTVLNETCLCWRRQSRTKEIYTLVINGYRWYQMDFRHRLVFNVTTQEEVPLLCLELHPATNYTVTIISVLYQQHPAQVNITTSIAVPPLPKAMFKVVQGQLPRVSFHRVDEKHGLISSYQVFVIHLVSLCSFSCESLEAVTYFTNKSKTLGYITAEFFPRDISDHLEFSVGDRKYYGEFYNAPLARGEDYCIILRIISKWDKMKTQSCMVVAEIRDLPPPRHHVTVVLLASIAFVCFLAFMTYTMTRCCKRYELVKRVNI
ncbi:sushi domain-containing protein 1 isoform X2 [Spea bombifrons]|uniref:sushi domain-containing protein 1 isoform X2 n=1 Tax=Spea bombifrons TaxID=233779 RepID=UPI0023492127|nr:sushi domain-containing protein 1 isoform X2 [Spea bombifrons]